MTKKRNDIEELVEASLSLVDNEYGTCIAPGQLVSDVPKEVNVLEFPKAKSYHLPNPKDLLSPNVYWHNEAPVFDSGILDKIDQMSTTRWTDRIVSSSGDWSGNIFDFVYKIVPKRDEFERKVDESVRANR